MAQKRRLAELMVKMDPEKGIQYADRLLEEEGNNLKKLALEHARVSAIESLGSGIVQGEFNVTAPDGTTIDPTYTESAKGILQKLGVEGEDPMGPLQEMTELRKTVSNKNYTASRMRERISQAEGQMGGGQKPGGKPGKPGEPMGGGGPPNDELLRLIADAKAGDVTPEEWDKRYPDAAAGTAALKSQMMQLQMENEKLKSDAIKAATFRDSGFGMKFQSDLDTDKAVKVEEQRGKNRIAAEQAKGGNVSKLSTVRERSEALARISKILKDELGERTPKNDAAWAERERQLRTEIGLDAAKGGPKKDSAEAILNDAGASKEEKIRRAKALGFKSYAEVEAAARK